MAKKESVAAPYSKFAKSILDILVAEGYLAGFKLANVGKFKQLEIQLKYQDKKPAATNIVKVSKPGRRIYRSKNSIPQSLSGIGITIVSTPKGVMTDRQAQRKKLGGEVICQVW